VDESKITVISSGWDMSEKMMDPATAQDQIGLSLHEKYVLYYGGIREQK
jgi:hypothetical protein